MKMITPIDPRTMNAAAELVARRRLCRREDRNEVNRINRQLDAMADRLGLDVAELVDRAEDAIQALAN